MIGLDSSPEMVIHAQRLGGDSRVGDVARPPLEDDDVDETPLPLPVEDAEHAARMMVDQAHATSSGDVFMRAAIAGTTDV